MSVDSTALLNRRHLEESCRDEFCLRSFPAEGEELSFDEIVTYKCTSDAASAKPNGELPGVPSAELLALREKYGNKQFAAEKERIAVITYGNGVPTAMLAAKTLSAVPNVDITVVDSPYLTHPPEHLKTLLRDESFDRVVFADVCKVGTGMPLAPLATVLQNEGLLDTKWRVIGASNTYNPLGNTITFLSTEDIIKACVKQL
jgi:deoxyxylulose-5-phosphate synthase